MTSSRIISLLTLLTAILGLAGCSWYDNRITYFNTYYNMQRIRGEVLDEFDYQDELKRNRPRVLVPGLDSIKIASGPPKNSVYQFLRGLQIDRTKLQPVTQKVDSILIKGSKVVAFHPKSQYIEGSLFLMAEAYFFRSEWVPSQQKCLELIERFPDGEYSPDAHILLAKVYLMQRKVSQGTQALSKAVDVAWYRDRYDVASEAYRIQAEMAIEDGDIEKAIMPYKQALIMCEDAGQRSKWQIEIASIYYRIGKYALAEAAFKKVFDENPDALGQFESLLYIASCRARQGAFDEASEMYAQLEDRKAFTEWASFIQAERLAVDRLRQENAKDKTLLARERFADTSFVGKPELMAQSFQKGMALYKTGDYQEALKYFAKAKVIRTPVYDVANKYYSALRSWDEAKRRLYMLDQHLVVDTSRKDSINRLRAGELYAIGRVHENLDRRDSALIYYRWAFGASEPSSDDAGKCLFAQARLLKDSDPIVSDSLFEVISLRWPRSPFAKEAAANLGFTADATIDDAAELYASGSKFRAIKDYAFASRQYMSVVNRFPESELAPKALYAMGWMFERDVHRNDSAIFYYQLLLERYPRSEYAREVRASVEFALAKINGVEVSDSTLLRDLDKDLLQRATEKDKDVMQQLMDRNQDAFQVTAPNMNLPQIPGMTPGGSINNVLQGQMRDAQGRIIGKQDTTVIPPPLPKP
ncbi:MAG: tetratricopeptide repeat protein [Bacteroidota bacterium]